MALRQHGLGSGAAVLGTLLLSACGGDAKVTDPLACFPKDARAWVAVERTAPPSADASGAARMYVDRSGSMAGYLAGSTAAARPLQDLIGTLPASLKQAGMTTSYAAFGTRIAPHPDGAAAALMRPAFYTCAGAAPGSCDNQESRFDLVFKDVEARPSELALVVSDLWFVNSAVQTSALASLAEPIAAILAKGRAIAIYGISAPFRGRIYDLPFAPGSAPFAGEHPLFLVAVGSDAQIEALHRQMMRSPSPYLADGVTKGTIKRALFTLNPAVAAGRADAEPLGGSDPAVARTPVIGSIPGVRVQQLEISRGASLRAKPAAGGGMSWTGPQPASFRPDAVWRGGLEPRARIWERRGDKCTPADWIEGRALSGLWQPAGEGQYRFRLDPRAVATGVGRAGTYLLTGELRRTDLASPNPAAAWMRAWGFAPADTRPERQGARGAFYPTLHLGEVARLMENALAEAGRTRPEPLSGFNVVVRITD